jgi:hypothetical protein
MMSEEDRNKVATYLHTYFPKLSLQPPIFYSWDIGIRFQMGESWKQKGKILYLQDVYDRAIKLFRTIFHTDDNLVVVINVHQEKKKQLKKTNIYNKYVTNRAVRFTFRHFQMPFMFDETQDEILTHQFHFTCKTKDLRIYALLKAIANQDFGAKPSFPHEVYFLHAKKGIIFYLYDDRGCDVIAASTEELREIYQIYSDWILDYDKEGIDNLFLKS